MTPAAQLANCVAAKFVKADPLDLVALCHELGLRIREVSAKGFDGALIRSKAGQKGIVAVKASIREASRKRFTIAHEIGHFILHKGMSLHVDQDFRINLRDGSTNDEEIDANAFAAELLMPTDFIGRDMQKTGGVGQQALERLARRYQVSARAMEIRLTNLGLKTPL
ncbi:MAG: ImmA/IrrE family metallo-endopeptidase [Acidobacteriia bacterium]|nr:ImmA/IrrE family metallo-endopeptidase [Terriglobia bacterium]